MSTKKAANALQKSHKPQVMLYRLCLKLNMAALILAVFQLYNGASLLDVALPLTVAICAGISYTLFYYLYKSPSYPLEHTHTLIFFQITMLLRLITALIGLAITVSSAILLRDKPYLCFPIMAVGLALCQLLHNNKKLFSHLSTFCENASFGTVLVTMAAIYASAENKKLTLCFVFGVLSIALMFLQEVFFHFFNRKKHNVKDSQKKREMIQRMQTVIRNIMIAIIAISIWTVMVYTGVLGMIVGQQVYEYFTKLLPLAISLTTLGVLLYNNFFKKTYSSELRYNRSDDSESFRSTLKKYFGVTDCPRYREIMATDKYIPPTDAYTKFRLTDRALSYVTEHMSGSYKRDDGTPYYYHPIAVANILLDFINPSAEMLASALLHDCVEDLPECSEETIRRNFGETVAKNVVLLSKLPDVDYHERKNMTKYLFGILSSPIAAAVKTADRMNNNSTMDMRPEKIPYKNSETKELYLPFVNFASWLYPEHARFYDVAKDFFSEDIPYSNKTEVKKPTTEEEEEADVIETEVDDEKSEANEVTQ